MVDEEDGMAAVPLEEAEADEEDKVGDTLEAVALMAEEAAAGVVAAAELARAPMVIVYPAEAQYLSP